jgi:hypothetical protein
MAEYHEVLFTIVPRADSRCYIIVTLRGRDILIPTMTPIMKTTSKVSRTTRTTIASKSKPILISYSHQGRNDALHITAAYYFIIRFRITPSLYKSLWDRPHRTLRNKALAFFSAAEAYMSYCYPMVFHIARHGRGVADFVAVLAHFLCL